MKNFRVEEIPHAGIEEYKYFIMYQEMIHNYVGNNIIYLENLKNDYGLSIRKSRKLIKQYNGKVYQEQEIFFKSILDAQRFMDDVITPYEIIFKLINV